MMDRIDEHVDFVRRKQSRQIAAFSIRAYVQHTNAIVSVQHGHRVARSDFKPALQLTRIAGVKRMQHEWRQREVVDPVHLACDLNLLEVMAVDLDQDFDAERMRLCCEVSDEIESL